MEVMLSAREYSALAGVSERHARRLAESGKLDAIAVINSRKRREYAFPLATQSNEIQLKYYEQHGLTLSAPEKTALQKVKPSPVQRPLDSYTDADRDKIGFWQDVVDQWMLYRSQTGKPLSELDHKFVQHMRVENPGMELSVPTLYRKKKALDEGDLDSVIDRRGKARKGKTDMPEYIKKTFLHYYLVDGGEGHPAPEGVQLRDRLCGLISRQFGVTAFPTQPFRFLTFSQGNALIEGLKKLTERKELEYLHSDRYRQDMGVAGNAQ